MARLQAAPLITVITGFKIKMHWNRYNRQLANRGSLTVYLGDELAEKWAAGEPGRGTVGRPTRLS